MARTIAFVNHKGGVGKTTSVACIGTALARDGHKVLLLDLDAQQNLTYSLLGERDFDFSIFDTMVKGAPLQRVNVEENLDLVPSSLELARADMDLASRMAREGILRTAIAGAKEDYDFILLDCSPSLGIITTNALVAADEVFIPLTAEALPLKGLTMLNDVVNEVVALVNSNLKISGIFFTRYNNRNLNKEVIRQIKERFGEIVFDTIIRENISLAEMPLSGKNIFDYAPDCNGAKDYKMLAREIILKP